MSEDQTSTSGGTITQGKPVPASSFRARMLKRQEELAEETTEVFPIPRFNTVLAVELKYVDWDVTEKSSQAHRRTQQKTRTVDTAADEIVAGTVAFHEIKEDGTLEKIEDVSSWKELAEGLVNLSGTPMPPRTANRIALKELCTGQGVMALSTSFRMWMTGAGEGLRAELRRDFQTTT